MVLAPAQEDRSGANATVLHAPPGTTLPISFTAGTAGLTCVASVQLNATAAPNSNGVINQSSFSIPLQDAFNNVVGGMTVTLVGPIGDQFVGSNPSRFGANGGGTV